MTNACGGWDLDRGEGIAVVLDERSRLNSLLHWPAGIAGAQRDGWANWGNNRQTPNPSGHCRPSMHEEAVAIVKTAERVAGTRGWKQLAI